MSDVVDFDEEFAHLIVPPPTIERPRCKGCSRTPEEISEYVSAAKSYGITPAAYVQREEGTFNWRTNFFYCTGCYIRNGMPLGKA